MVDGKAYDTLCEMLEPYVALTIPLASEKELADLIAKNAENKATLKEVLKEEEPDETMRKSLEEKLSPLFDYTPNPQSLRLVRIKVVTEALAVSWSEALRWVYKEQGETKLRDYLLPEELGRASYSWKSNLNLFGLGQEQMEDLLRIFGQQEIADSLELPWGGYVIRAADGFKLSESYHQK